MWIDTTQVYGFSNPDEWREANDFAENLKKSNIPFLWKEDTNSIRIIITDYIRGKMNIERKESFSSKTVGAKGYSYGIQVVERKEE